MDYKVIFKDTAYAVSAKSEKEAAKKLYHGLKDAQMINIPEGYYKGKHGIVFKSEQEIPEKNNYKDTYEYAGKSYKVFSGLVSGRLYVIQDSKAVRDGATEQNVKTAKSVKSLAMNVVTLCDRILRKNGDPAETKNTIEDMFQNINTMRIYTQQNFWY